MKEPSLIADFDQKREGYGHLCERLESLLRYLLNERGIAVHSISSRTKDRDSIIKKVERKTNRYRTLEEITDLAGVRIIAYFADQVDSIARVIRDEFEIDEGNSVDKGALLDPDRFGYLSLHFVVSLSQARSLLTEYQSIKGLKAEIQIRSILQHAWAEIEHDLGYKAANELPRTVRRQFARLAGLLELADSEFVGIRRDLDAYSHAIGAQIVERPDAVELNKISLIDFVRRDPIAGDLDARIAAVFGYSVRQDEDSVGNDVGKLEYFGLNTIGEVREALRKHQDDIINLGRHWASAPNDDDQDSEPVKTIPEGVSLFYLCHVLAGASQDLNKATAYLDAFSIGDLWQTTQDIASDLIQFMRKRPAG